MSTPALGVVSSAVTELPPTYVVAHPGTSPTLTVPVVGGRDADLTKGWAVLAETASFFGTPMPDLRELEHAYAEYGRHADGVTAVKVTVVTVGDAARFVITGTPVPAPDGSPVRIDVCDAASPLARSGDPVWRRMAGRTTSRGEADQLDRWLQGRGFVDAVPADHGPPFLGALVFACGDDIGGLDDTEPASPLDQLQRAGVIAGIRRLDGRPATADRVWWISPLYAVHPVEALGTATYAVTSEGRPRWWRA